MALNNAYPRSGASGIELLLWDISRYEEERIMHKHEVRLTACAKVGQVEIGICVWSDGAEGGRDMHEAVAYASLGGWESVLATMLASSDEARRHKTVRVPLPKQGWLSRQRYRLEEVEDQPSLEAAVRAVQEWAERRQGITESQQEMIAAAVQAAASRQQAMEELGISPEEDWARRLAAGQSPG